MGVSRQRPSTADIGDIPQSKTVLPLTFFPSHPVAMQFIRALAAIGLAWVASLSLQGCSESTDSVSAETATMTMTETMTMTMTMTTTMTMTMTSTSTVVA
eukprot:symbB.v1.2.018881.t1/scaffold1500.1/size115144/5